MRHLKRELSDTLKLNACSHHESRESYARKGKQMHSQQHAELIALARCNHLAKRSAFDLSLAHDAMSGGERKQVANMLEAKKGRRSDERN